MLYLLAGEKREGPLVDHMLFWTEIGAIAQVLAALATVAAVWTSLWLAHSERRAYVKVWAGLRVMFAGDGSPFEDVISINITNYGLRPVRISNVAWRTGWLSRGPDWLKFQYAVQKFDRPITMMTSPIPPYDLESGQEVTFYVSPEPFKNVGEFSRTFFSRTLLLLRGPTPTKICTQVFLVAAKKVTTRVEPDLEKFLATGQIPNGADKANERANAKRASAGAAPNDI